MRKNIIISMLAAVSLSTAQAQGPAKYTAVPTILLKNYINLCKSGCYERKIARWISESDFVL